MAKSRKDWAEAQRRRREMVAGRIWPAWTRTLGALLDAGAIVRFACGPCRRVYDVDLRSLAVLRGREWSLIGRTARCKASTCRTRGLFIAAANRETPFLCLGTEELPTWLIGARPKDHDADGGGPEGSGPNGGGVPPCPKGVDAVRWAYASERERKQMVRQARG